MLSTCTCMCWSLHANKNNHENLFWFCRHVGYKNHPKEADCCKTICWVNSLQGISKRLFPGWVKSGEKVEFCLPSAGRQTQFFHHLISQRGKNLLEIPCSERELEVDKLYLFSPRFKQANERWLTLFNICFCEYRTRSSFHNAPHDLISHTHDWIVFYLFIHFVDFRCAIHYKFLLRDNYRHAMCTVYFRS